jgi:hypothetical protein
MFKATYTAGPLYTFLIIIVSIDVFFAIAFSWWQYILASAGVVYVAIGTIAYFFNFFSELGASLRINLPSRTNQSFGLKVLEKYLAWTEKIKLPSQRNQLFASAVSLILSVGAMRFMPQVLAMIIPSLAAPFHDDNVEFRAVWTVVVFLFVWQIVRFICTVMLHLFSLRKLVDVNLETIKTIVVEAVREENQKHHSSGKKEGAMMN